MLLTLFLLGLVYAVLIGVLFAAGAGAVTIAVVAGVLFLIQFFTSDKIALASMGAHAVSPRQAPELHALIERLCIQANLPKPRVAIAQTAMPNAFAVGRSPRTATVCATTGLLELLSASELEGVIGHELTHVANRDVMVMTIASFFRRSSTPSGTTSASLTPDLRGDESPRLHVSDGPPSRACRGERPSPTRGCPGEDRAVTAGFGTQGGPSRRHVSTPEGVGGCRLRR